MRSIRSTFGPMIFAAFGVSACPPPAAWAGAEERGGSVRVRVITTPDCG